MAHEKSFLPIFNNRIFQHCMFWIGYVLVFGLLYGKYGDDYFFYFKESLLMLPFIMVAAYIINYGLLPRYLKTRKYLLSCLGAFLTLIIIVLTQRIILRVANGLPIQSEKLFDLAFLYMFLETSFVVGVAFVIKLMKYSIHQQQQNYEIEKRNLQAELKLLKAQIQPHFLFNTMNNLYALSLDQSVKTSEGIAKISELLSIILYECNEPFIKLEKEVKLLRNYIDLEKLRYGKRLKIDFDVEGELKDKAVIPMLFITFLENCFKHGSSGDPDCPWIKVKITAKSNKIIFMAENSVQKTGHKKKNKRGKGIGLENVKRRLNLLYKDLHQLTIKESGDRFLVELILQNK